MATGSCDLTGRTERETLVNQLGWSSGWLSKLAKEYKSFKEVISSCLTTLAVQKDSSLQDRCSAVCMMLKGALSTYNERYYEDDGTYDVVESVANSADRMEKLAKQRAEIVYGEIDRNKLFIGTAEEDSRSRMNITFVLKPEYQELQDEFMAFATSKGMVGVKGHRDVGGFRASCYNAMTIEGCEALVACMKEFEKSH